MKVNFKSVLFFIALILVFVMVASFWSSSANRSEPVQWSDVMEKFENNEVTSFTVSPSSLLEFTVLDANGKEVRYRYQLSITGQYDYLQQVAERSENDPTSNLKSYDFEAPGETPWLLTYLPYLILLIGIILLVVMYRRFSAEGGMGGRMGSFARAKPRIGGGDPNNTVHFSDVAGADEEKEELQEVVEFLRDPQHFTKLGARIPRGVLLVGPPGTGKTLLAKAVAGEANVPFYSISGSDFVEMYVGVGASRVRDLFDTARKSPASIVFIDEIDAVGRHRGAGLGGGNDEREQTLNQLLVEMDGFGTHQGLIVIAATNRPDVLDPALLRPGRFDRQITVGYPDIKGREDILKVHARGKPFEDTVSFKRVAQLTIGFTGADLANLLNEAALLAARRKKDLIGMNDIEDAYMKILLGPRKKNAMRNEHDNRLVAYHEAGHALAAYYAPHADPVKQISILPAGYTGGVTIQVPEEDRLGSSRGEMLDRIVVCMGGRVAEQLVMDDISTGASNDIQQATKLANAMVTRYGMSERLGTILYGTEHGEDAIFLGRDFSTSRPYSEQTAAAIDEEIRRIVEDCYHRCEEYLREHLDRLHFIAEYLLKHELMDGDLFAAAMTGNVTMEDLENMEEEKKRKSEEANRAAAARAAEAEPARTNAEREMFANLGISLPPESGQSASESGADPKDGEEQDSAPKSEETSSGEDAADRAKPDGDPADNTKSQDDFWKL